MATRRARSPAAAAPAFKTPQPGDFAIDPPIEPMLAKAAEALPSGEGFLYEPKWDGFRAIVFRRGPELYIQSRDSKPLDRYFPELHEALLDKLPNDCVLDGEVVIATARGLDFDALQLRVHPAASRVAKLAAETPSSFVVFDALSLGGRDLTVLPLSERRALLEQALAHVQAPVHLTPVTREHAVALTWLSNFEGAGLDGVMAKREEQPYQPGKRAMFKIKHARTADCVVAGFRWHKNGPDTLVGSLLLGLFDDAGTLQHVGVTSSFTMARRKELVSLLAPLREDALTNHPWRDWAGANADSSRMPGAQSRWSGGKDLSWQPLRIELVCEVKYDHLQGDRFRHAATFLRFRSDKQPADCRYDQLEVTPAFELAKVFGAS
ncbi:MAG: ATP-dependent ligase [Myxococcaceae bacterium]|nr:ATP-dependent ligase [Myxococcaceae bacterium]